MARRIARFLELSRAPFFSAVLAPAWLGTALAYREARVFHLGRLALTLVGLVAAHAGSNLLNDYFDFQLGADRDNPYRGPYSGGSPHLAEGREVPRTVLKLGLASFAVAGVCALVLAWIVDRGWGPVLVLALAGAFLGVSYTAPPFKLAYRGLGEAAIFLAFGVLPVAGAYYVQTGVLTRTPFWMSVPLAFLITNVIWINEFPDREPDGAAGKRHHVVRLGTGPARWVYHSFALAAYAALALLAWRFPAGRGVALGLVGAPFAFAAARRLHRDADRPHALRPAQAYTIAAHALTGAAMGLGVLWP